MERKAKTEKAECRKKCTDSLKNGRTQDRYGVPMIRYCKEHEACLEEGLSAGVNPEELLLWHEKKLAWMQHERLVHLLVTMLTAAAFLFSVVLGFFAEWSPAVLLLQLILLVLFGAYLRHYFKLENTVQHWYRIADRLYEEQKNFILNNK